MKNVANKMLLVLAVLAGENCFAENLFRGIDFGMKLGLQVPFIEKQKKKKNDEPKGDYKISGRTGFTIRFRDAQLRLYDGVDAVQFLLENAKTQTVEDLENVQYGALFSFENFVHFPLTIKAGKLSFSDLVSEMNAPKISATVSPFSKSFMRAQKINASLPTLSSTNENFGVSLDIRAPRSTKHFYKSGGSFFWDQTNRFSFAGDLIYSFDNLLQIGGNLSVMRFSLGEEKDTSSNKWFTKSGFYHAGNFFTAEAQIFFYSPYFATRVFCNVIQQPVLRPRFTFGNETKISFAGFTSRAEFFLADGKDIVKPDNNLLKKLYQWKVNANYTFRFSTERLSSLTIGAGVFGEKNYEFKYSKAKGGNSEKKEYNFDEPIKVSVGLRYKDRWISSSIQAEIGEIRKGKKLSRDNTYSARANFSYKKGIVRPSISLSYQAKKTSSKTVTHTESAKLSLAFPKANEKFSVSTKFEMVQANKKPTTETISLGFGFTKKQKFASYKFSFNFAGAWNNK